MRNDCGGPNYLVVEITLENIQEPIEINAIWISSFRAGKLSSWASSRRAVTRKTCCCTSIWDRRKWLEVSSTYFVCALIIWYHAVDYEQTRFESVAIHSSSTEWTQSDREQNGRITRLQTQDSEFNGHRSEICRALVLLCVLQQNWSDFVCNFCVCIRMLVCGWVVECRGFDAMHMCALGWFLVNERKFGCVWQFGRQMLHIGSD